MCLVLDELWLGSWVCSFGFLMSGFELVKGTGWFSHGDSESEDIHGVNWIR